MTIRDFLSFMIIRYKGCDFHPEYVVREKIKELYDQGIIDGITFSILYEASASNDTIIPIIGDNLLDKSILEKNIEVTLKTNEFQQTPPILLSNGLSINGKHTCVFRKLEFICFSNTTQLFMCTCGTGWEFMDGITPKEWKLKITPKYKELHHLSDVDENFGRSKTHIIGGANAV